MANKFVGQEYMAATNGKGLHQQTKGHRILARTTVTCSTIITIISIFIVAFCLVFQMCPVIGTSMMTTLNATGENTDSALTCTVGTPAHGDIVVMKMYLQNSKYRDYLLASQGEQSALDRLRLRYLDPNYNQQDAANTLKRIINTDYTDNDAAGNYKFIVKRLIGKGGDRISMRAIGTNYYIYLNGTKLNEDYLDPLVADHDAVNFSQLWKVLNHPETADLDDWVTTDCNRLLTINDDQAFDGNGTPSTYVLTVPDDYYFLMGDNRGGAFNEYSKSWDSTYFGPLPTTSYSSYCVDVLSKDTSLPEYLWNKFVYYVCFGWAWQK